MGFTFHKVLNTSHELGLAKDFTGFQDRPNMAPISLKLFAVCWKDHYSSVMVLNTNRLTRSNPCPFAIGGSSLGIWGLHCMFFHLPW